MLIHTLASAVAAAAPQNKFGIAEVLFPDGKPAWIPLSTFGILLFMSVGSLNGGRRSALPLPPPAMCPPVPLEPQDAGSGTAGEVTVAILPKAWRHIRSLTVPLLPVTSALVLRLLTE